MKLLRLVLALYVYWLPLAALAALAFLCCGCTESNTRHTGTTKTQETVVEKATTDGGRVTQRAVITTDDSSEKTTTGLDQSGSLLAGLAGTAIGTATGTGGVPWVELISGGTLALAGLFGGVKHGQASKERARADQLEKECDYHKDDAEKGWSKATGGDA